MPYLISDSCRENIKNVTFIKVISYKKINKLYSIT